MLLNQQSPEIKIHIYILMRLQNFLRPSEYDNSILKFTRTPIKNHNLKMNNNLIWDFLGSYKRKELCFDLLFTIFTVN